MGNGFRVQGVRVQSHAHIHAAFLLCPHHSCLLTPLVATLKPNPKPMAATYSGALADRIWNFGNSQIEYFFGLPKWVNLGKAQNSQLEYFHPRRGPCS